MNRLALFMALTLGAAGPALSQTSGQGGNAEQQSRPVPQTGQTSGGPANTANPSSGAAGSTTSGTGTMTSPGTTTGTGPGAGTGAETRSGNSAASGNADQPSRAVPQTGQTSGGPARQ